MHIVSVTQENGPTIGFGFPSWQVFTITGKFVKMIIKGVNPKGELYVSQLESVFLQEANGTKFEMNAQNAMDMLLNSDPVPHEFIGPFGNAKSVLSTGIQ